MGLLLLYYLHRATSSVLANPARNVCHEKISFKFLIGRYQYSVTSTVVRLYDTQPQGLFSGKELKNALWK